MSDDMDHKTENAPSGGTKGGAEPSVRGLQEGEMVTDFEKIADVLPAMLWTSAPEGGRCWFSAGWLEFTGLSDEEQRGDGWMGCVHPADRADVAEQMAAAIVGPHP